MSINKTGLEIIHLHLKKCKRVVINVLVGSDGEAVFSVTCINKNFSHEVDILGTFSLVVDEKKRMKQKGFFI